MFTNCCIEEHVKGVNLYDLTIIINTHEGSQFTTVVFVAGAIESGLSLSMDGTSTWADMIFIVRF